MSVKEATFYGNRQVSEVTILSSVYNQLIAWGFTCDTTIEEQCVQGNKPRFTFDWLGMANFTLQRDAVYESGSRNYTFYLGDRLVGTSQFYTNSNMESASDVYFNLRLVEKGTDGFILFIGSSVAMGVGLPVTMCVGYVLAADGKFLNVYGLPNLNNVSGANVLFDWLNFERDGKAYGRVIKIPSLLTPPSEIYIIDDYPICSSVTSLNRNTAIETAQVLTTVPMLKVCSAIPNSTKITVNGKTYMALDSCTLAEVDDI